MRSITLTTLAASLLFAGVPQTAAQARIPKVKAPPISMETVKTVTRDLSSDAFEGRAPGTAGEEKTLAYLTRAFAEAGLQPGNPATTGASWFQDVPLIEIGAKNMTPLVFTGGTQTITLNYGPDMVGSTYQVVHRIALESSDVVFVGYGINAPEKGWNDYAGVDVKGKTVIILVNDPDYADADLTGPFNGRAMTYYGRWTYKYEEAARQGAAAAFIVHDTRPAAYGWNVVQSSWTGPQIVAETSNAGADQTKVNGWIQLDHARKLFTTAGLDFDVLAKSAVQPGFKATPLNNVKASLSFENDIRRTASKNVIGILSGKKRPDEYVLYTAHWDHLGRCQPAPDGDDICNGAVDNANGTAALVALAAAHVKKGAPDRSLVFLAVTAEESGLLGSAYYAANPVYPLAKTVGGINMDALSMAGPAKDIVVVGKGKSELDMYLDAAARDQKRITVMEPTPEKGFYYRSDHFSFAKRGVPMLYFESGEDLINGGVAAGAAAARDYTENRYHGAKDEYDPNWDWSGVAQDVKLFYVIGRQLASTNQWPNWVAGDEFRAIRDKSLTEAKMKP